MNCGAAVLAAGFLLAAVPLAGQGSARPTLAELKARAAADSNAPEAHYSLAMGYWIEKRWDDAARELDLTLQISPGYAEAWLSRSELVFKRGEKYWKKQVKSAGVDSVRQRISQAFRDQHRAFLLDPMVDLSAIGPSELGEPPHLGADAEEALAGYRTWWMDILIQSIGQMEQGRYPDAAQTLQGVIDDPRIAGISSTPDFVVFYHGLASAHAGDFRRAIEDFKTIRLRNDRHILRWRGPRLAFPSKDLTYMMATAAFRGGYMDEAIDDFHQVIEADLSFYMAHSQLALIYSAAGAWDLAITERKAALDVNPDDPTLLVDLSRTLIQAGHPADAEAPLVEAGQLNPRDALAPFLLGQVLEKLGRTDDARDAYRRFLLVAPASYASQSADLRSRLGL